MSIKSFRDLIVWQKAMDFVKRIYLATKRFPHEELFGLTQQLRRACVSIPSNIAEGHGRPSTREFLHFLGIAYGSLNETQTQIMLTQRFCYLETAMANELLTQAAEVARLLNGLRSTLTAKLNQRPSPETPP